MFGNFLLKGIAKALERVRAFDNFRSQPLLTKSGGRDSGPCLGRLALQRHLQFRSQARLVADMRVNNAALVANNALDVLLGFMTDFVDFPVKSNGHNGLMSAKGVNSPSRGLQY